MVNYLKKIIMILFFTNFSYSFLRNNIPNKNIIRSISSLDNDIYNDIYYDIFSKKNFLNNSTPCYSINLPGPDNFKICKNCKYFVQNDIFKFTYYNNNINITSDISGKIIENININTGFCSKFTIKNKITGDDQKLFAFMCRSSENLCGNDGKYYEEKDL